MPVTFRFALFLFFFSLTFPKAGTAPAEVDSVSGRDINPHIPSYIMKTPWFYEIDGATLEHQRNLNEQKKMDDARASYNKGFVGRATTYRAGACENCGSMTHAKKDCFYRPRKKGAAKTNEDIMPDEVIPQTMSLDYDGKRDRWAGYDASQ
jgi:pre-mRNA-processing factor SLU7